VQWLMFIGSESRKSYQIPATWNALSLLTAFIHLVGTRTTGPSLKSAAITILSLRLSFSALEGIFLWRLLDFWPAVWSSAATTFSCVLQKGEGGRKEGRVLSTWIFLTGKLCACI
jgi:hypothetical protein